MATEPFIVYKASAGAGKTYALVKEYLKMAFSLAGKGGKTEEQIRDNLHSGFRSILAITFTKKATAEMKDRILDDLAKIARRPAVPKSGGIAADVLDELNAEGIDISPEQLQQMAILLRRLVLHRYSDLSVSTIDSFMHRIVRTFAHDMGQPMNFDVLVDQQKMIDEAVAQLMALAGTDGDEKGELADVLKAFAESNMEDNGRYNVEKLVSNLASQLFLEDAGERLKQLSSLDLKEFKTIRQNYVREMHRLEDCVRSKAAEMLGNLNSIGIDVDNAPYGMTGYYGYFSKMADGSIFTLPSQRTVTAFEEGKMTLAKCSPALSAAVDAAMPKLRSLFEEIKPDIIRHNTYRILLRNLYSVALLGQLDKQMRLYSKDNDVVHLSDFNKLINAIVEDEENPAPFVYERLGNRYGHFLVDEFQDTSIMQWHNLVPLLENGVSQGMVSLVVGDGKQSIYRFRQGDVQQFVRLPHVDGMKHHGKTLPLPGNFRVKNLIQNRRSAEAIINFNNRFFNFLAREVFSDNPLLQSIYIGRDTDGNLLKDGNEELYQETFKKIKGHVEVNFLSKADAEEGGFDNVQEAIYDGIIHTIRRLVSNCGYAYKDIVVLARTNTRLAKISRYMSEHSDIPKTSTESFYLKESHAVMAVIAVLRLLHNNADRGAEADLLYRLAALGIDGGRHAKVCDNWAAGDVAAPSLPSTLNLPYLASLDIYDCCEEIVRSLQLDDIDSLYVASLLNNVAAFSARHRQDIGDFLQWFDEQKNLSASSSEEGDAVQLYTIHKAKGLGKPVIICPLFNEQEHTPRLWVDVPDELKLDKSTPSLPTAYVSLKADESSLFDPQKQKEILLNQIDELNVLYVALTRPMEQLFLFCPDPTDIKKSKKEIEKIIANDRRPPALLYRFVNSKDYDRGDDNFQHVVDEDEKKAKKQNHVRQLSFNDWTKRVLIASPSEKAITPLQESKIRFGIYAHDLLAGVLNADNVDAAIERFHATGQATDEEMQRLADLAHKVVADEATHRFFAPEYEVKNECELVTGGTRYRPDRVVFTPHETWVIDFKTGEHLDEYADKVRTYCQALRDMGYPNVSGWLLYLQPTVEVEQV